MIIEKEINGIMVTYNSETGELFRLLTGCKCRNLPPRWKQVALAPNGRGYLHAPLNKKKIKAHRIAWFMVHGEWPQFDIDHINHCRTDNRIANLRLVTDSENCKNRSLPKDNKSGVIGVIWHKVCEKWVAQANAKGKHVHLGVFSNFEDAVLARSKYEATNQFHENHGAYK